MSKVFIGVPCTETGRHAGFVQCLESLKKPEGTMVQLGWGSCLTRSLNDLTAQAIKGGFSHLWILNDDLLFPPDTLERLLAHGRSISVPFVLSRFSPFLPLLYDDAQGTGECRQRSVPGFGEGGLVSVAASGGGGMLIDCAVFAKLQGVNASQPIWECGTIKSDLISEDMWFCHKVRAVGETIWCDLDTPMAHMTNAAIQPMCLAGHWHAVLTQNDKVIGKWPLKANTCL